MFGNPPPFGNPLPYLSYLVCWGEGWFCIVAWAGPFFLLDPWFIPRGTGSDFRFFSLVVVNLRVTSKGAPEEKL